MKGEQEVGGVNKSHDSWIMLFSRDPVATDMYKLVTNTGSGDKGDKGLQLSRLVFSINGRFLVFG